jgi:5-methylcytosine-specific restriction endonuclease McrA
MPWETARKDPAYGTAAWRNARDACLRRVNWRCEIRIEGVCIGAASEADHIDQLANDPQHKRLRAACKPCHRAVTAQQGGGARGHQAADPAPQPRTAW